jgi:hypothetical protein
VESVFDLNSFNVNVSLPILCKEKADFQQCTLRVLNLASIVSMVNIMCPLWLHKQRRRVQQFCAHYVLSSRYLMAIFFSRWHKVVEYKIKYELII